MKVGKSEECFPEVESILKYFALAAAMLLHLNSN